jgi:hypothetical protein
MCDLCVLRPEEIGEALDPMWNCLEHFEAGRTKLLHFTDMDMQPWRHRHNPLKSIWRAYYRAAVESGAVDAALVAQGIANGWLLPELAECLRSAPSRLSQAGPPTAALAGSPSVRQRSLELEATALRAELGIARLDAEYSRNECYRQFVELGNVQTDREEVVKARDLIAGELGRMKTYAAELEQQVRTIPDFHKQIEKLYEQIAKQQGHIDALYQHIGHLEQRIAEHLGSWSWRIGQAVTKPARVMSRLRRPAA